VPLIERDECLRDLGQLLSEAPKAFHDAMRRMRNAPPEDLVDRSSRSGSNLTRDYAVSELRKLWSANPAVQTYSKGLLELFVIDSGKYAIRIKKLDGKSRSSNVKTRADYRFRHQMPLPGIPDATHLELGYRPNILRTAVEDVQLVCLNGRKVYWSHSIGKPADDDNIYDLFQGRPHPNPPRPTPVPRDGEVKKQTVTIKPKKR
jgi:hypothetical protein